MKTEPQYRGTWRDGNKYRAVISINGKRVQLGNFETQIEASRVYELARLKRELGNLRNMKLNQEMVDLARQVLKKNDRIILKDVLKIKQSAVYQALRGERKMENWQIDAIQSYIKTKIEMLKCQ